MVYKYIGFTAAFMVAVSPCLGVHVQLRNSVEGEEIGQNALHALAQQAASASSHEPSVFGSIMSIDSDDATQSARLVWRNKAALRDEDYARIRAGEEAYVVVDEAQKRFAREHDVPQEMAPSFSVAMGEMDKKGALLECIYIALFDPKKLKKNPAFEAHSEDFLTYFLNALFWIGKSEALSIEDTRHILYKRVIEGATIEGAATLLLTSKFSVPGEAVPDPTLAPLIQSLPVPVRLRASTIYKTPAFMKRVLAWVGSQDEERALASLSFLARCENDYQGVAFMDLAHTLTPSYIGLFVTHWPSAMTLDVFSLILGQGDLTENVLTDFKTPWGRVAISESRKILEVSLLTRLLGSSN